MRNARAKRAKILFFIVKYANLWGFCCRRRRGCLSSLFTDVKTKESLLFGVFRFLEHLLHTCTFAEFCSYPAGDKVIQDIFKTEGRGGMSWFLPLFKY